MTPEFSIEREVLICARRETVFRYFTDNERWASWWGAGSTIEPRPGGAIRICYPGAVVASGTVESIVPGKEIAFTYGYETGQPFGPGTTRVRITVEDRPGGTLVSLHHKVRDAATQKEHATGWRYQLAVFANVVTREAHAGAAAVTDRWFAAWAEQDEAMRRASLEEIAVEGVVFRDPYGCVAGIEDLNGHIGAAQFHMPGMTLARAGEPAQCQGTAVVDWQITGPGGAVVGKGSNVFDLAPDGRIARCVGLWRT